MEAELSRHREKLDWCDSEGERRRVAKALTKATTLLCASPNSMNRSPKKNRSSEREKENNSGGKKRDGL